MRFRMIAAKQFVDAELKGVTVADHAEIVRELVAAQDGDVGYKNARSQVIDKAGNLQSHLPRHVGNHIKAVIIPLNPGLVLGCRTELTKPAGLQGVVIGVDRTTR